MERQLLIDAVQGMQRGEEAAFTQLYEAFQKELHYFIYKTVKDSQLAEDLTQDTFLEILQSIHSLQEPAAFPAWSRQIAYRRCTAYFKKRRELLADEDEDGYSVFDTMEEDRREFIPDEALEKKELKQAIHSILDELPEEQRAAAMMRYFDEIAVSEIAKIQNVPEGTVKSRLSYARKAIKKGVEAYEKKHGIQLPCVGILPLLLWLMRQIRLERGLSLTTGAARTSLDAATAASLVAQGQGAATAVSTASPAVSAASPAVSAAAKAAAGGAGKAVSGALAGKIAAGIVAACLAVGGAVWGITALTPPLDEPEDHTEETTREAKTEATTTPAPSQTTQESLTPPTSSDRPSSPSANGPRFADQDFFTVYSSEFQKDLKAVYRSGSGILYVETLDGKLYSVHDSQRTNDLLAEQSLSSWSFTDHTGLVTLDENGYYRVNGRLAHSIKGEILYAFYSSFSGQLCVYSVDDAGTVYYNSFQSTGKKSVDNQRILFYEKRSTTQKTAFETVEEIRVLPVKGSYPDVLIRLNGKTYVDNYFSFITAYQLILNTSAALADEVAAADLLDHYDFGLAYGFTYRKEGVNDRLFLYEHNQEHELVLPDGHTLDEMTYFNRGKQTLMAFANGDVYTWALSGSELPQKHEGLSAIGGNIQQIFFCLGKYRILMSDNVIYDLAL